MYNKVDSKFDFVNNELEILKFWKENKIFEKSMKKNEGKEVYSFYDGPPTANGVPHIGHILTRSIKDIFPRYKCMKGFYVPRVAGWDTHGLPVELEVEKQFGMDGKKDIEKFGIEPFIQKCKESVWKYKKMWEDLTDRVAYWVDMENPYITYDNNYIESVWWSLSEMHKKGLIYKGYKIVPYCPRCGTALSSHEVAQNYQDVKEKSAFVNFELKNEKNTYFVAWTTTPWTLPSNVALCVHPELTYVKIEKDEKKYILAQTRVDTLFEDYEILDTFKGTELEFLEYNPLYSFESSNKKAFYITVDEYVTADNGSGIVHIAPAFGEDDSKVGYKYDLPFTQTIGTDGKFKENCGEFSGLFCKKADKPILIDLHNRGLLLKDMMYEHSYPFCWRCDTPLIYYARESWFIKTTSAKDNLIKNNRSVNWLPANLKEGRMGNFLENVIDWGFSRERYWGTPLPIWICKDCGEIKVIGSIAELKKYGKLDKDVELHKPYVDEIVFDCEHCNGKMYRTPEVMDCWYDSGSMPFAQMHYPFENKEKFEQTFPASFISEGVDQTRGWFYSLQAINTILFDQSPYKNVISLGLLLDNQGKKMSKSKGNSVNPWDVFNKQGADALRWYFYISNAPWLGMNFDEKNLVEHQRKLMGTLWNVYSFYILYAEIDQFNPTKYKLENLSYIDKWIMSKYNTLVKNVTQNLDNYLVTESAREIAEFVDILSNWYIRRNRETFWASGETESKTASFMTLYTILEGLTRLLAPFVPFIADTIYQNIVLSVNKDAPVSVHLTEYPVADESLIDIDLENGMNEVLDIVVLGRVCRNATNIKNRQVLSKIMIYSVKNFNLNNQLIDIIKDELNVEDYQIIDNANDYISYNLKPNLKTLGPKYGKLLGKISATLASSDANNIVSTIKMTGSFDLGVDTEVVTLTENDILISVKNIEGFSAASDERYTVILDTLLNDNLIKKGVYRELISKVQNMRKDSGLEVTDRIDMIIISDSNILKEVISENTLELKNTLLCTNFDFENKNSTIIDLNGNLCDIIIKKSEVK